MPYASPMSYTLRLMPYALCLMPDTATPIGGGAGAGAEGGAADVHLRGPRRGGRGACALSAARLLGAGNAPDASAF